MSGMTLRVRCPTGQGVLKNIDSADTIENLILNSFQTLGLPTEDSQSLKILSGFPPKPLDLSDRKQSIGSLGVRSGDTLIYQIEKAAQNLGASTNGTSSNESSDIRKTESSTVKHSSTEESPISKRQKPEADTGGLQRQVVPADNSCLFTSINFCMCGEVVNSEHTGFMRELISVAVREDQNKYSEAFLGRPNEKYCNWIMTKDAWGGAIELQILSEYFQVEIVVVDTKSGCLTRFGETENYPQRMVLIYDGIHYDPLYLAVGASKSTIFPTSNESVLEKAKALASQEKAKRNYTDTTGFQLKCLVCGHLMKGEKEAQDHAASSKHINFSEV